MNICSCKSFLLLNEAKAQDRNGLRLRFDICFQSVLLLEEADLHPLACFLPCPIPLLVMAQISECQHSELG